MTAKSVIRQDCFSNIEWIVIDGGSTDGSIDVLKKYNDKVTFCISEPDGGIYDGMNKGIIHAKADYVLFLNTRYPLMPNFSLKILL